MKYCTYLWLLLAFVRLTAAQPIAAELSRILAWGSRPWEPLRSTPLVLEQRAPDGNVERVFYFVLEAADLDPDSLRLPVTPREKTFVAAVDHLLRQDGPADWPIFVFSAPDRLRHALDVAAMASTRRIILRDRTGAFRPAAAIVLNSAYWGIADPSGNAADAGMASLVASHETYHARRVWLHAGEIAAHADVIESRLRDTGDPPPDRKRLELLVSQEIAASEELAAIDCSLHAAPLRAERRRSILEHRETARLRDVKLVKSFLDFFTSVRDAHSRREIERWLTGLLSAPRPA